MTGMIYNYHDDADEIPESYNYYNLQQQGNNKMSRNYESFKLLLVVETN